MGWDAKGCEIRLHVSMFLCACSSTVASSTAASAAASAPSAASVVPGDLSKDAVKRAERVVHALLIRCQSLGASDKLALALALDLSHRGGEPVKALSKVNGIVEHRLTPRKKVGGVVEH